MTKRPSSSAYVADGRERVSMYPSRDTFKVCCIGSQSLRNGAPGLAIEARTSWKGPQAVGFETRRSGARLHKMHILISHDEGYSRFAPGLFSAQLFSSGACGWYPTRAKKRKPRADYGLRICIA